MANGTTESGLWVQCWVAVGEWREGVDVGCRGCGDHPLLCVTPSCLHSVSVRIRMGLGSFLATSLGRMTWRYSNTSSSYFSLYSISPLIATQ